MVTTDFRPEAEFTLFLRMRTKHLLGKYIPIEVIPYYKKSTSPERMAGSDFLPEAPK